MSQNRSPNRPKLPTITRSPGSIRLASAASSPDRDDPEAGNARRLAVLNTRRESSETSSMMAVKAGSNWPISGIPRARRTLGSGLLGPDPSRSRVGGFRSPNLGAGLSTLPTVHEPWEPDHPGRPGVRPLTATRPRGAPPSDDHALPRCWSHSKWSRVFSQHDG